MDFHIAKLAALVVRIAQNLALDPVERHHIVSSAAEIINAISEQDAGGKAQGTATPGSSGGARSEAPAFESTQTTAASPFLTSPGFTGNTGERVVIREGQQPPDPLSQLQDRGSQSPSPDAQADQDSPEKPAVVSEADTAKGVATGQAPMSDPQAEAARQQANVDAAKVAAETDKLAAEALDKAEGRDPTQDAQAAQPGPL